MALNEPLPAIPELTAQLRRQYAAIADFLIPAYQDLPPASAVGIEGELLDRVLKVRPDLIEPLIRGLKATLGQEGRAAISELSTSDPAAADAIFTAVPGGYYLDPGVRQRIGYPGQETLTNENPYAPPFYATDGTLDRVLARGPIYVPTPGLKAEGVSDPFRLRAAS